MLSHWLIVKVRFCITYSSNIQKPKFLFNAKLYFLGVFIKIYHLPISVWSKNYVSKNYFDIENHNIQLMIHTLLTINKLRCSMTYIFVHSFFIFTIRAEIYAIINCCGINNSETYFCDFAINSVNYSLKADRKNKFCISF